MLRLQSFVGSVAAALLLLAVAAVSAQSSTSDTIFGVLRSNVSESAFFNALASNTNEQVRGYVRLLNSTSQNFTVFAPDPGALANLSQTQFSVDQILLYHISNGTSLAGQIVNGQLVISNLFLQSLGGAPQRIKIITTRNGVLVNSNFVSAAIRTANGEIIYLDSVLVPPLNFTSVVNNTGSFSTFLRMISIAYPNKDCPCNNAVTTVLAPTDKAFENADPALVGLLLLEGKAANSTLIADFVEAHLIPNQIIYAPNITTAGTLKTKNMLGDQLVFSFNQSFNSYTINNTINVVSIPTLNDILTDGGVAHAISSVIVPRNLTFDVQQVLLGLNLTTFLDALETVGFNDVLFNTSAKYTLFVPINSAIGTSFNNQSNDQLRLLLNDYIVKDQRVMDFVNNDELTTLNKNHLLLNVDNFDNSFRTVQLEGNAPVARIVRMSTLASNAVVYEIDSILKTTPAP